MPGGRGLSRAMPPLVFCSVSPQLMLGVSWGSQWGPRSVQTSERQVAGREGGGREGVREKERGRDRGENNEKERQGGREVRKVNGLTYKVREDGFTD